MSGFPNHEQQGIIDAMLGPALVLAPAGTGKTAVMAERLAQTPAHGIDLGRTLCVTFTNRAADEMKSRVAKRLGEAATGCRIHTFHGLCAWILKCEARDLGLSRDFVIYDEEDCKEVLQGCLRDPDLKPSDAFYELSALKSHASGADLQLAAVPPRPRQCSGALGAAWVRYHEILAERHALDFSDLVCKVRAMFLRLPDKSTKWSGRFDWLQVDEIQDTHQSEYEIVSILAHRTRNVAFFGDLDQTIYEWRGSDPERVMDRYRQEFAPVGEFSLTYNYRATKNLLRAADRLAGSFERRRTHIVPAATLKSGEPLTATCETTTSDEARWIATQIGALRSRLGDAESIGILARTHKRTEAVSKALSTAGIRHVTVEQYQFFLRQEIKDILARLRFLLNPHDTGALGRIVRRPSSRIGEATLKTIRLEGEACALRLPDLLHPESHRHGEPFTPLLAALQSGTVVVLDVETTGFSPVTDEVIDLGAVRIEDGRETARFERLLCPTRPVGDSEAVHGLSDGTLRRDGGDPAATLAEFREFIAGAHLVGHNVRFDLSMLKGHAARLGIDFQFPEWSDTLDLARRLLALERYDLGSLGAHFGTAARGSHRALADSLATADVLAALHDALALGADARRALVAKHGARFAPMAGQMHAWRVAADQLRPPALAERIINESGLRDHYSREPHRLAHLETFVKFLAANENRSAAPLVAMEELVAKITLARNVDHLDPGDTRIPVITVHQSKGLEFDTVFLAGASEGEFPSYFAVKENDQRKIEEERRLFYVAITRARRRLFLSAYRENDWGYDAGPSRFMEALLP
jgi:DNA helicase-2/ATP-dependent DNA helicase PcrA